MSGFGVSNDPWIRKLTRMRKRKEQWRKVGAADRTSPGAQKDG